MKRVLIEDDLFGAWFLVQRGGGIAPLLREYASKLEIPPLDEELPSTLGKFVCANEHKGGAIYLPQDVPLDVVTHEAFHATAQVMRVSGVTFTDSSEEAFAYYLAWLMRSITRNLW